MIIITQALLILNEDARFALNTKNFLNLYGTTGRSKLSDKWIFSTDEQAKAMDENYLNLPAQASQSLLKMAVDTGRMPFAYVKDNKITGYDIELISRFCKAMG